MDHMNYHKTDGKYHLKLCYPEIGKCNEWIQSSHPFLDSNIKDFKAISLDWKLTGAGTPWGGLARSDNDRWGVALADDSPGSKSWHCAIGSKDWYPEKGKIPGPNPMNLGFPDGITQVVLSIWTKKKPMA